MAIENFNVNSYLLISPRVQLPSGWGEKCIAGFSAETMESRNLEMVMLELEKEIIGYGMGNNPCSRNAFTQKAKIDKTIYNKASGIFGFSILESIGKEDKELKKAIYGARIYEYEFICGKLLDFNCTKYGPNYCRRYINLKSPILTTCGESHAEFEKDMFYSIVQALA